ncbi:helix-turn-helix domain-containing protein [Nocardia sp. NPDC050378]|uniref:helix-turn-helix domain-containing protein n=1 Tax=Nocardia sp. NPDC050378 TaxID=3155400 RepID=UPI00340565BE
MATESGSEYLTVEQAAEYLGTGVRFIRRIVAERRVVFYKVGNYVRFKRSDLEAFAQAGRVDVAPSYQAVA